MNWLFAAMPASVILLMHFWGQRQGELLFRASNYWVVFFVLGYFVPLPLFIEGQDGWTEIWGYGFSNFEDSLARAVGLATAGGILMSLISRRHGESAQTERQREEFQTPQAHPAYVLNKTGVFAVALVSFSALAAGIYLVGGLLTLIQGLGDRIALFAGLNAFFLPLNLVIGACLAISAANAQSGGQHRALEYFMVALTIPALFLLGQKANIFILLVGLVWLKLLPRKNVSMATIAIGAVVFLNALMIYEYVFREALIIGVDPDRLTVQGWSDYVFTQVTANFMQLQNLTVLVDAMPKWLDYQSGDTYLAFFSAIIPAAFIEVKPLTAGGVHTLAFWPDIAAGSSTTMPTGLFGEAYMNFGWIGFLGLAAFLGMLLRKADSVFSSEQPPNLWAVLIAVQAGAMALHFVRGEFFSPFIILAGMLVGARASIKRSPESRGQLDPSA
jgi:oligosaccharide repeat unit polymerase